MNLITQSQLRTERAISAFGACLSRARRLRSHTRAINGPLTRLWATVQRPQFDFLAGGAHER